MKRLIFWIITLVVLAVAAAGIFWLAGGLNFWKKDFNDYGGQTPEETMRLLIAALEKGNAELAGKYFMPDDKGGASLWEDGWRQAEADGRLPEIINQLKQAQPNPANSSHAGDFKYVVKDENGVITATIDLELLEETGVWKIEAL